MPIRLIPNTLFFCLLLATQAYTQGEKPAETAEPWDALLAVLPQHERIEAQFTEVRTNPVRRRNSVLKGVMRFDQLRGVSMFYNEPFIRIVVISGDTIEIRNLNEHSRSLPADGDLAWVPELVGALFSFEATAWQKIFILHGFTKEEGKWTAILEPKEVELRNRIQRATITGNSDYLTHVELLLRGGRRTEIRVEAVEKNLEFSDEIISQYF